MNTSIYDTRKLSCGLLLPLLLFVFAAAHNNAFAQPSSTIFDHHAFGGYINTPTVAPDGTLILRNTNARPSGSQAYVTGVGSTAMPVYSAGDTLQWAVLARTTTGAGASLNIGVQNGSGDVNNLSLGQLQKPSLHISNQYEWVLSAPVQVDTVKNIAYFWIPGAVGQEIQVKQIVLGDPADVQSIINAAAPAGNLIAVNPSFEIDADANGFADGWAEYINIGSASLSGTEVFEGNYSQRLVGDLESNLTGAGRIVYTGRRIPVVQNQPYTFAYWFKAEAGTSAIANIKGYGAAGGEVGAQTSKTVAATGEWQRIFVTQTFTDTRQVSASVLPGLAGGPAGRIIYIDAAAFAPDDDSDGVFNTQDNCRQAANSDQVDTDGDGAGNSCDSDDDNDGVSDAPDNCPLISNADQADADGDGSGNRCDSTPNGDADNDGIDNLADNCPMVANPDQHDIDGDEIGDTCDSTPNGDTDNDVVDNLTDNCPTTANTDQSDAEGDAIGDVCDSDDDNDDTADDNDAFPLNPNESIDTDNDGVGNNADKDDDGDGQSDVNEISCGSNPLDAFSKSMDIDGDNISDCVDTSIKPRTKDQCKNDGWKQFNDPSFKNQGDCIQSVNTGK